MYGKILRKLRQAKRRGQAEVARHVGISPAQLARLEMNQRGLYVEDFVAIAEVLGEKPGNLLPNDLGDIGHLKPIIDRLAGLQPEFLERVESIIEKTILLTDDVLTTVRTQAMPAADAATFVPIALRERRRKMSAKAIAVIERVLGVSGPANRKAAPGRRRKARFAGTISGKDIEFFDPIPDEHRDIPQWASANGAAGALKAVGSSMRDVGIVDGDIMFIKLDHSPPNGKTVIGILNNRLFVKILKRDKSGRPVQLGSKNPESPPIEIQPDDKVKFYCVVVGISGHR
jgi:transcriptional regulator with XRE-family HTH domain